MGWPFLRKRLPRRNWGDPHLAMLDGRSFDFFGIGQFWCCRSPFLAYQFRFFAFKRTSFIGAIALKLGNTSVLTINTKFPSTLTDLPVLRLNGNELSNLNTENKFKFHNDSLRLDISLRAKEISEDDPTILFVSLKFSNGASLSIVALYSSKMKRQYLTLITTPINEMINKTSGICGYFNDGDSDDLMGPDGKNYTYPVQFVESWKMKRTIRNGGGLPNSWSDPESNFHEKNSMDKSYIDPTHKPLYSLNGFTQSDINTAKEVCTSDRLSKEEIDQCIYDVVTTNDPNVRNQAVLKANECPEKCSNRGNCVGGKCVCIQSWSGESCEIGECGKCVNGNCSAGFCECVPGFQGPTCETAAICEGNCSSKGECVKSDVCKCDEGWTSKNCSEEAVCSEGCSDHGICIDHDICKCEIGYNGTNCATFSCEVRGECSQHGICIAFDQCLCFKEWTGLSCSKPICKNDCSGHGKCTEPGVCTCEDGYSGDDCGILKECPLMDNCNGRGM
ncbi:unnamed protein product [Dimorphilus gyrociliatus]|uniref:Uncharacterized protein n=1 Tax=Dimorphilus gyrociliatus TaxID=2664684 RepID=A0A7I8W1D8_9ANNE|nr:unnamed protein product [Dimorphilus gyrociliatus]